MSVQEICRDQAQHSGESEYVESDAGLLHYTTFMLPALHVVSEALLHLCCMGDKHFALLWAGRKARTRKKSVAMADIKLGVALEVVSHDRLDDVVFRVKSYSLGHKPYSLLTSLFYAACCFVLWQAARNHMSVVLIPSNHVACPAMMA